MKVREAVELYLAGANMSYIASSLGLSKNDMDVVKLAANYVRNGLTIDEAIDVAKSAVESGVTNVPVSRYTSLQLQENLQSMINYIMDLVIQMSILMLLLNLVGNMVKYGVAKIYA